MKAIASTAVSFALLGSVFSGHLPAALTSQTTSTKPAVHGNASQPTTNKSKSETQKPDPVMVVVQPGDSLTSIADANATTYVRMYDANDAVTDPNVINPGQQLRVPTADEQLPDRPLPQAAPATTASYTASGRTASASSYPSVTGNDAKAFIYSHESGNNPNSRSASGCYGLGQDCNGRVQAQCGADYACQDAYFTSYANSRYGGWDQAAAYWQTHGWW